MKKQYYLKAEEQIDKEVKAVKFTWKDWVLLIFFWMIGITGVVWKALEDYQEDL